MSDAKTVNNAKVESVTTDDVPAITINRKWCKGCGICIAVCPADVYQADRDGKPVIAQPDVCIWCERCETYCPDFAINLHGKMFW